MTHIIGHDRAQTLLLPEMLDDYVDPENPLRFIEALSTDWISPQPASPVSNRSKQAALATHRATC